LASCLASYLDFDIRHDIISFACRCIIAGVISQVYEEAGAGVVVSGTLPCIIVALVIKNSEISQQY